MGARRNLKFAAAVLFCATWAAPSLAAELVMVDQRACTYCAKLHREVGKTYEETSAGQRAPLRRVSTLKKWPADLDAVTPTRFTPVFIVVEVGRFPGYTTPEKFWKSLDPLLAKLEVPPTATKATSTTPAAAGLF